MIKKILSSKKVLGVFSLAMINVALMCALRGLPTMAEYGLQLVFFLTVAILVFLIPVSLVSAELATGWPKKGGIYAWIKQAFGEKVGFFTICLQWLQSLVFYPTALAATAGIIAYLINPELANNKYFTLIIIIIVYWGATLLNLKGMKSSSKFNSVGTMMGIILPGSILIILGIIWLLKGEPSQIELSYKAMIPNLSNIQNIVLMTGMFLFFAGIEVSGVHALEVNNPQKDYPKAIMIAALIAGVLFLLGSLAIAIIIPQANISLTAGIMETFYYVFDKFNVGWLVPVMVLLAAPGAIVQVSSWIVGPSRGILATAENGDLPPFFQKLNKNNMPINIMFFQGILVTIISGIFLFMPSVSSSFWILTALAAILYLTVYIIMFLAAIKLRYTEPKTLRPYKVPGGNLGMWIIAGIGIVACLSAIILGFIPPSQVTTGNTVFYVAFLLIGYLVIIGIPLVIYHFRKPSWKKKINLD